MNGPNGMDGMNTPALVAAVVLVLVLLAALRWAARHMGGSTADADAFMDHLAAHPSRGITPGGGR